MTSHLTKIALGTLALFFVCMIAGATMLKSKANKTASKTAATAANTAQQSPKVNNKFDPVELSWNQPSKPGNISYYGGQMINEKSSLQADNNTFVAKNLAKTSP